MVMCNVNYIYMSNIFNAFLCPKSLPTPVLICFVGRKPPTQNPVLYSLIVALKCGDWRTRVHELKPGNFDFKPVSPNFYKIYLIHR